MAQRTCKRVGVQARPETGLSCPKGPPPDAVHMSSKLVGLEPVQNTQKNLCAHLCILVEEEECIGHVVIAQVDDTAAHPAADG